MKITISALAVLVTANLAAASTASTRANTEATKIRSDYEKRVKAEIDSVYPEYDKTVDKAVAGYRLKRKALYSTCSALGSAGVKLGTKFETAIKVYESTIEDLTNLAVLKTNLTEIRDAYKIKIFTPATANVTALSNAISKYPKTSPCWDDNKESVEYRKEEAATIVEQNAQYYFDDEENVSMHLFALQSWLDSFTYEAGDLCNTNKTCKLTYVSDYYMLE